VSRKKSRKRSAEGKKLPGWGSGSYAAAVTTQHYFPREQRCGRAMAAA